MSILEGSAFAIPRRVMVHKDDYTSAKMILRVQFRIVTEMLVIMNTPNKIYRFSKVYHF